MFPNINYFYQQSILLQNDAEGLFVILFHINLFRVIRCWNEKNYLYFQQIVFKMLINYLEVSMFRKKRPLHLFTKFYGFPEVDGECWAYQLQICSKCSCSNDVIVRHISLPRNSKVNVYFMFSWCRTDSWC